MQRGLNLSQEVSMALDFLGYNIDMIKWRRRCYKGYSDTICESVSDAPKALRALKFQPMMLGSKVEGTTILYESDEDFILVFDSFVASRQPPLDENKVWLKMETENVDPGYALLKRSWPKQSTNLLSFIDRYMTLHSDGFEYLSIAKINQHFFDEYALCLQTAKESPLLPNSVKDYIIKRTPQIMTPSQNYKIVLKDPSFTVDVVTALICDAPEILDKWGKRERRNGWPSRDQIQRIMGMPGYLVAIRGSKKSDRRHLELRMCYTLGELHLMKSLNETQTKLYVLLKQLFKYVVEPLVPKLITSYMLKNIVFWLCEGTVGEFFRPELLLDRLIQALKYIYMCVQHGDIPNYFIPERNMLAEKQTTEKLRDITKLLENLIAEGPKVVFRIKAIQMSHASIQEDIATASLVASFRNRAEIFFLEFRGLFLKCILANVLRFMAYVTYRRFQEKHFKSTMKTKSDMSGDHSWYATLAFLVLNVFTFLYVWSIYFQV